jgi:hypothetical protein
MVRTAEDVPLAPYSEEYAELPDEAIEAVRTYLTKEGKMKLASCMAQGCQLLHALWQTAWAVVESKGVADAYQGQRSSLTWSQLEAVCWPRGFLQSVVIGDLSVVNGRLEIAEA